MMMEFAVDQQQMSVPDAMYNIITSLQDVHYLDFCLTKHVNTETWLTRSIYKQVQIAFLL